MKREVSCGVIPVRKTEKGSVEFLLVQGYGGFWGFPKGHKEGNETHIETAKRELLEETGLEADCLPGNIFTETYKIARKKGPDVIKKVVYYIGFVNNTRVTIQRSELRRFGWFDLIKAKKRLIENRQDMLDEVIDIINEARNPLGSS